MKLIVPKRLDKCGNGSRVGGLIDNILHVMAFVCSNYGVTTHL